MSARTNTLACLAGMMLAAVSAAAQAERIAVEAGQTLIFNFDLPSARVPPWPPYTGVSLATGVADAAAGKAVATWQVFSGRDGTGKLLFTGSQDLVTKDLFGSDYRYGRFSVRLTVSSGTLSVDPLFSAFRNHGRELGVEFGEQIAPVSVTTVR